MLPTNFPHVTVSVQITTNQPTNHTWLQPSENYSNCHRNNNNNNNGAKNNTTHILQLNSIEHETSIITIIILKTSSHHHHIHLSHNHSLPTDTWPTCANQRLNIRKRNSKLTNNNYTKLQLLHLRLHYELLIIAEKKSICSNDDHIRPIIIITKISAN